MFGRMVYVVLGLAIVGGYALASMRGMEFSSARTRLAPGGVRGAHNGVFWYGGYRGGK